MKATDEQLGVIESGADNLLVKAYAGTGKTTTLVKYAEANPRQRMLYLAFNKSIQLEAARRFPSNVVCRTTHGLAFAAYGNRYTAKLRSPRAIEISRALGLSYPEAQTALSAATNYMSSKSLEIGMEHVPSTVTQNRAYMVMEHASAVWKAMTDPANDQVGCPHDAYLKLFQLSNPVLRGYDRILLDEGQDTNPVTADIFFGQRVAKTLVGDPYQAIYGFRGAEDALSRFAADETRFLTKSFRFGAGIAGLASALLRCFFDERRPLVGLAPHQSRFEIDPKAPYTILCRTNAGLFGESVAALQVGKMHFVGGIDNYQFDKVLDAYRLKTGAVHEIRDAMLKSFRSYADMAEYAKKVDDKELSALARVADEYGARIPSLVNQIRGNVTDASDAKVILTTAHKSKGMEWDQVKLADDFPSLIDEETGDLVSMDKAESREEVRLLYVVSTRAMKHIALNAQLKEWSQKVGHGFHEGRCA